MKQLMIAGLLVVVTARAAMSGDAVTLSLKDAIGRALEHNLDLRAELLTPAQSESELRKARGIYNPLLTVGTSYRDSFTYSVQAGSASDVRTFALAPGISQLLATGGTLSAIFNNTHTSDDTPSTPRVSYWKSDLTLSLSQPLMKNSGREATELNIASALHGRDAAMEGYRLKVTSLVAQVRKRYFNLFSLRESLASRRASLELARRILSDTRARVSAGVMPAMETLNAEFGVSSREREVLEAERALRDEADALALLLRLEPDRDVVTLDPPPRNLVTMGEADAIRRAQSLRPELADLRAQILSAETQERVARGRTQPELNFSSSLAVTGAGTGYGRDLDRVGSARYPVWSVGLNFDYPIGNQAAENEYQRSRLKSEQLKVRLDAQRETVANEVRAALRAVVSNHKQLDVTDRSRAYAEERLKAYAKKTEVGLATTKDLLDVENDLTAARSSQIAAQVAYGNAVTGLLQATGELLEAEGITITPDVLGRVMDGGKGSGE